jgi:hypothetical protein
MFYHESLPFLNECVVDISLNMAWLYSCEKYSPSLNTWQRIPAMNIARRSPGVANYKDR